MGTFLRVFVGSLFIMNGVYADNTFSVIVETSFGKLEGSASISRMGRDFFAYRGIPFAEKTERFQVSQLSKPWSGVKKAIQFGNACPQFDPFSKTIIGSEDCLFLNVYTPLKNDLPNKKQGVLPVMVWFYPGSFTFGKSDEYDPKYFMDENVVLVTVNYRMGALGFLDTGDEIVPGNLGLKDQVLALKWVQKTIAAFAGDASKVTIFGCSAVHYHMLSSMSKGLFRNAISQSGTSLSPLALQRDPEAVANLFAEGLKCPTEAYKKLEMVECLKTKTVEEIIQAQLATVKWFIFPFNIFVPSVEKGGTNHSRFLESHPLSLISSGKYNNVPWICGFTEDEGTIFSTPIILMDKHLSEINEEFSKVLPIALDYEHIFPKELRDNVSTKILTHYFGNEEISEETWASLTDLFSDRYFIHSVEKSAKLHAKFSPVYAYQFSFTGEEDSPIMKGMFGISGDYGIAHSDELQYLFSGAYGALEHVNPDKHEVYEFSQKFVKLWTSFATNNKPTATWKTELNWEPIPRNIGDSPIKYYQLSGTTSLTDGNHKEGIQFWDELDVDNVVSGVEKMNIKEEL